MICCDKDRSTKFCCECGKKLFEDKVEQEDIEDGTEKKSKEDLIVKLKIGMKRNEENEEKEKKG